MPGAGLFDSYRYGVRFVGYLLTVTLVAGVFAVIGAVMGGQELVSAIGSGGVASVAIGTVVAAIALIAISLVLFLSGFVGLVYKLVADAAMMGVVQGRAAVSDTETGADSAGEASGESETGTDERSDAEKGSEPIDGATVATATAGAADADATDDAGTESATAPSADAAVAADEAVDTTEEPVADAPDDATVAESPSKPPIDAQTVIGESNAPADEPADGDREPPEGAPGDTEPSLGQPDARVAAEKPVTGEGSGVESVPTDANAHGSTDEEIPVDDGAASTPERDTEAATQPDEWSPPDPSEFDAVDSASPGPTEESASGAEAPTWETDGSDGDSTDGPRTADDLFGEEMDDDGGDVEDVSNLFSAGEDDPVDDEPLDLSEDGETADEPDKTSAFETDSDGDPLSDALDDS